MTFNFSERYIFAVNILLAALVIPYFAARSVSDMIKMHYASSVVPAATDDSAEIRGSPWRGASAGRLQHYCSTGCLQSDVRARRSGAG